MVVGVVSDTHGVLPEGVAGAFEGVACILHAGDVGSSEVLRRLENIAPVTAVLGNTDGWALACILDRVAMVVLGGRRVILAHHLSDALRAHRERSADVIVCGHTHVPAVEMAEGALVLNPGSASRPRSRHGATVGLLEIATDRVSGRIVSL